MNTMHRFAAGTLLLAAAALAGVALAEPASGPSAEANRQTLSSGLTIVRVAPGDPAAKPGDTVFIHYLGRLQDSGREFDSSYKRGEPISFALGTGRVIRGWEEGIAGMQVGEKRQLTIPPDLAYGAQDRKDENGTVVIPANSTLVFDLELVGLVRREQQK